MTLFRSNLTAAAAGALAASPMVTTPVAPGLGGDDILAASKSLVGEANPLGMMRPFLPHQGAAYLYALDSYNRWGGAFLGDDMGLGKTQVLLALANDEIRAGGYVVMVAPQVAKVGYQDDLAAAFPTLRFAHLYGRKPERDAAGEVIVPAADIYFISDDALTMKAWLTHTTVDRNDRKHLVANAFAQGAHLITRDEIHRDKGAQGKPSTRAKVMLAVANALRAAGRRIVGATGTVLTNRPVEAYIPLQIVGGPELVKAITPGARSVSGFLYRYCAPKHNGFGYDYNGVDMDRMAELHDNLRRTVYVRREKRDLGDTLPHGGWIIKPIALNGVLGRYERIEKQFLDLVREEEGPEAMWRKARAEAITRMSAMWAESGVAKAAATVEYVTDLVEQGRQVVCFYYHNEVFAALAEGLLKAGISTNVINGAVTGEARADAVRDFQTGKVSVMLAQIKAAGMAVTLTAAADAVFCQVPWSAGDLKQAADRILRADALSMARAARNEGVTWHVLQSAYADGAPTFDMAMWGILERKAAVCDAVNAGKAITMPDESVMRQALEAWYASRN